MKLIVGLGNPGLEYERTRHNAGWMALDELARRHASGAIAKSKFHAALLDATIGGEKCLLMKPTTYMNRSGLAVGEALRFYKLEPGADVIVLVDDVALPVGEVRVRERGGDGGHNGLADIDRALGYVDYARIRIGIGAVPPMMVRADWVLSRFMSEESEEVRRSIVSAADAVELTLSQGVSIAMNRFNRKIAQPQKGAPNGDAKEDSNEDAGSTGD
ncbi:MAG: aminoacyl-tRNA hydrolase [Phycisphaerales bacterium]